MRRVRCVRSLAEACFWSSVARDPPRIAHSSTTKNPLTRNRLRLQRIAPPPGWGVHPGIDPCPEYRSIVDRHSDPEQNPFRTSSSSRLSINNTSHLPLFSNPSPNNLFRIITKRYLYRQVKSGLVTSVVAFSIDSNQSRVDRECSNSSWRSWKKPGGVRFSEGIIILLLQLLPPRYIPSEAWVVKVVDRDRRSSMATTQVFQDWDSPHETISSMTRTSTRKTTTKTTTRREVRKSEETRVIRRYYVISGKFVLSTGTFGKNIV